MAPSALEPQDTTETWEARLVRETTEKVREKCALIADEQVAEIRRWVAARPDHPENGHRQHAISASIQIAKDIRNLA